MFAARTLKYAPVSTLALGVLLSACGGGGDGGGEPPPATMVTVAGRVTYARVPFRPVTTTGLDYNATFQDAASGIRVEARGISCQCVLASTRTNANGDYTVQVASNQQIAIRAIAHLLRQAPDPAPHWDIAVRNGNADTTATLPEPYSFTGGAFDSSTPNGSQNLQIPSGWNNATRQPTGAGARQSAPFAILATIQRALDFLSDPQLNVPAFPVLNIDWSETKEEGQTFYASAGGANSSPENRYISLSGEADADIDEFDQHTIAHEFGHYIEDRFSRSDSVGGPHGAGDTLDPRVAFGEGFGYAFAAMVLNDPLVRDAGGSLQNAEGRFSVETDAVVGEEGWFSEASSQEILWDLFDPANEATDGAAFGFTPLWSVLVGEQRVTPALTTIFSFGTAVKALPTITPAEITAVNTLLGNEATSTSSDAFAVNEMNDAGRADILPLYRPIAQGGPSVVVISTDDFGSDGNKLGARRYLRFEPATSGNATLNVTGGTATHDIDVLVFRNGAVIGSGTTAANTETVQFPFSSGQVYVFEVYDCANAGCNTTTSPGETSITVDLN